MSFVLNPYRHESSADPISADTIVTDGLILYLDAGNPSSYPGTGTDWYDQSGNNNDGTLINGVEYSSDNDGALVFDGINDYVYTPVNIDANPSSVGAWFNPSITNSAHGVVLTDNGGWDKGFEVQGGQIIVHTGNSAAGTSFSISSNTWYYGFLMYTAISMSMYINGINIWNAGAPGATVGSTAEIGRANYSGGNGSRFFNGKISQVQIYNRPLSELEIQHNFELHRGRYGI